MCTIVNNSVIVNNDRWKPSLTVHNSVNPINLKPNWSTFSMSGETKMAYDEPTKFLGNKTGQE